MYSPDKPFTVYCKECWYSDNWDPLQYGQEYDWKKPFFTQFRELMHKVPRIGIMHIHTNMNADFANYVADSKNVYLSQSVIAKSENVYYSRNIDTGKDVFDCMYVKESERCYEDLDCLHMYQTQWCVRSRECLGSAFLFDCVSCQDCFMSANLRNKRYVVRNQQLTKEEYSVFIGKYKKEGYESSKKYRGEFRELMQRALHKYGNLLKCVDSTGDNLDNVKTVRNSFDLYDGENLRFCLRNVKSKDSYDVAFAVSTELAYEGMAAGFGNSRAFSVAHCDANERVSYCDWCQSSADLFGCAGLRKKQHFILNKQYSKEEYEKLKARIIEHMNTLPYVDKTGGVYAYGEFFPAELSPFAYNETLAGEYFPLSKGETVARGYVWRELDPSPHKPTIVAGELPDAIADVSDEILKEIIECTVCKRVYRILAPELAFLRREGIVLPRECQECRHKDRFDLRNPLKLWHRRCCCSGLKGKNENESENEYKNTAMHFHGAEKCLSEFETSYAPERPEMVYCESCYQSEVV